jgi:ABC-type amino acid transport substrate-binding protein
MSFNLRRRIRESKTNGLRSYGFEIVKNWRDPKKDMRPNHKTISYIQSIQEQHFAVPSNQDKLRKKIETETLRLLKDGTINQLDAQKILNKATEFGINNVKGSVFVPKKVSLPLPRSH